MKIVSVSEMIALEKAADRAGLSYQSMMQNAGQGIAAWVYEYLPVENGVVALVGAGNNGGDTLIALTALALRGVRTIAFLAKERPNDPLISEYLSTSGSIVDISGNERLELLGMALRPGVILLDGLLGTGFRLPLRGALRDIMAGIHKLVKNRPGTFIVAVDCPSGVDCDTGEVSDVTFAANYTLCMAAVKQGLLRHPGRSFVGEVHLIDIGLDQVVGLPDVRPMEMVSKDMVKQNLPARPDVGHKGTFGTCIVVAGTRSFTGAVYLTGKAAYRAGCGLVDIATLPEVQRSLAGALIEAVWTLLPDKDDAYDRGGSEVLVKKIAGADSLVLGPGLGLAKETTIFVDQLLSVLPEVLPTLIDADGLKHLSRIKQWWKRLPSQTILTPHPGEMSILTGLSLDIIQANRWEIAQEFAQKWQVTLILKGAASVIAAPSGKIWVSPVSDAALATAGSGDVLSGVIGGLMAQGVSLPEAGVAGTWLHTGAGVKARKKLGTDISVTAMDILNGISSVFDSLTGTESFNQTSWD